MIIKYYHCIKYIHITNLDHASDRDVHLQDVGSQSKKAGNTSRNPDSSSRSSEQRWARGVNTSAGWVHGGSGTGDGWVWGFRGLGASDSLCDGDNDARFLSRGGWVGRECGRGIRDDNVRG
jgi:hypothetical protein